MLQALQQQSQGSTTTANATAGLKIGDRVISTSNLNARSSYESGSILRVVPNASLGTIKSGPIYGTDNTWWQIAWDNGVTGWSAGEYIQGLDNTIATCPAGYTCIATYGPNSGTATSTTPTPTLTVSLTANPVTITAGQLTTLSMAETGANSCTLDGQPTALAAFGNGTADRFPTQNTTYKLSCMSSSGQSLSAIATVNVAATPAPASALTPPE